MELGHVGARVVVTVAAPTSAGASHTDSPGEGARVLVVDIDDEQAERPNR